MDLKHQKHATSLGLTLLSFLLVAIAGCAKSSAEEPEKNGVEPEIPNDLNTPLDSANYYLAFTDLDRFRPSRSRLEILGDLRWRVASVRMAYCKGKAVSALTYQILSSAAQTDKGSIWVHALFVDNKFEKFIHWLPDVEQVPYQGTTRSRPRPMNVDDCVWLTRALDTRALGNEDLRKEVKSATNPPEQIDVGLTIAWLMLRPLFRSQPRPSVADYKRNALLRDQFNAARLDLGMTEKQVEAILKAKPLERGKAHGHVYKIYGSNESFNIYGWLHYSNVLVVFREGKVKAAYSVGAAAEWRRQLGETFMDLVKE